MQAMCKINSLINHLFFITRARGLAHKHKHLNTFASAVRVLQEGVNYGYFAIFKLPPLVVLSNDENVVNTTVILHLSSSIVRCTYSLWR